MVVNGELGTHLAAQARRLKHLGQGAFSEALTLEPTWATRPPLSYRSFMQTKLTKLKVHAFVKHLNPTIFCENKHPMNQERIINLKV